MIVPSAARRRAIDNTSFCASCTSARRIGPLSVIASWIDWAARLDMQPKILVFIRSSTPFSATTRISPSTDRSKVPRFLSSSAIRFSNTNISSSTERATLLSSFCSALMMRCSADLRALLTICAASPVPPRLVVPPDLAGATGRNRSRSRSSMASDVTGPIVATRYTRSACISSSSNCSTSAATGASRWASTSAIICGCSFSIRLAMVRASIHLSASSPALFSCGVIRASIFSARSWPSAFSMMWRICVPAPKPSEVRWRARSTNWSSTLLTWPSLTSATLNMAPPSVCTSCGSSRPISCAASSSPSSISRIAAASLPAGASLGGAARIAGSASAILFGSRRHVGADQVAHHQGGTVGILADEVADQGGAIGVAGGGLDHVERYALFRIVDRLVGERGGDLAAEHRIALLLEQFMGGGLGRHGGGDRGAALHQRPDHTEEGEGRDHQPGDIAAGNAHPWRFIPFGGRHRHRIGEGARAQRELVAA